MPILYSYRRCPYAMRARMALKYAGVDVEIREISLRDKPSHLIEISPKATVPVLVLSENEVIDESLEIMDWALTQRDVDGWCNVDMKATRQLIAENDGAFKQALDKYKYADRYPEKSQAEYRADGEVFLQQLENRLQHNEGLFGQFPTMADIAIFPFIRQFRGVDSNWFDSAPYSKLKSWLNTLINTELFISIMQKHPTYTE